MDSSMFVVLLITVVGSVLITWLLPKAFHSQPPYGLAVDILAGTIAGIIWAFIAYQILSPAIGMEGPLKLFGSAADAIGLAAVMLWILRRIKR
jgi:uncharacterized membrane protein YeaQ/YmgE (transglycosylase-associated protein family)